MFRHVRLQLESIHAFPFLSRNENDDLTKLVVELVVCSVACFLSKVFAQSEYEVEAILYESREIS